MNHDRPLTWYVHRNLDAPIHQSVAALDTFARFASLRPASPYAHLLARPARNTGPAPPGLPSRTFSGRVGLGLSGRGIPVELDLTASSGTRCTMGVRPAGRRPPARRHARYFATTHTLLDDFALKLDLLIHLDGGPQSDTARHVARVLVVSQETPAVARLNPALM